MKTGTIGLASLRSEASRNLRSGTTRGGLFGVLWILLAIAALLWNSVVTNGIIQDAARWQSAGASVLVVESTGNIDGLRCESMGALPNVESAGAIRQSSNPLRPAMTPGVDLPTFDATPGFVPVVLDRAASPNGVFVSEQVASALGITAGDDLPTANGRALVTGVFDYPDDGRRALLGYATIQTVPAADTFDECWVSIWPESERARSIISASVLDQASTDEGVPTISQLNTTLGESFSGEDRYRDRATAFLPLGLLCAAAALGFAAVRTRRLELAASRLVGIRPRDQAVHLSMETLSWMTMASAVVLASILAIEMALSVRFSSIQYAELLLVGGGMAAWTGAMMALASISSGRALDYFRDR
jgi:hypothetical protein